MLIIIHISIVVVGCAYKSVSEEFLFGNLGIHDQYSACIFPIIIRKRVDLQEHSIIGLHVRGIPLISCTCILCRRKLESSLTVRIYNVRLLCVSALTKEFLWFEEVIVYIIYATLDILESPFTSQEL